MSKPKKKMKSGTSRTRQVSTAKKQAAFLVAYVQCASITHAARAAKVHRTIHYLWLDGDPDYAKAFEAAQDEALEVLEREARRRAVEGTLKPVFYKGEECGYVREYSDTLMIFLLKAANPEKYRERTEQRMTGSIEMTGNVRIVEDGEWYANADRLPAATALPSDADPA